MPKYHEREQGQSSRELGGNVMQWLHMVRKVGRWHCLYPLAIPSVVIPACSTLTFALSTTQKPCLLPRHYRATAYQSASGSVQMNILRSTLTSQYVSRIDIPCLKCVRMQWFRITRQCPSQYSCPSRSSEQYKLYQQVCAVCCRAVYLEMYLKSQLVSLSQLLQPASHKLRFSKGFPCD